jgi:MoxR-like ATPase
MEISHKQLKQVLRKCYKTKQAIDIKGGPGIGKSWIVREVATELASNEKLSFFEWNEKSLKEKEEMSNKDFIFADLRLSQMAPEDLRGLPDLTNGYVNWVPQLLWKKLSDPNMKGIVFFDEANLADNSILKSFYQIINDKQCGEMPISKNILFISAGNRSSDKANVYDEPFPLKNRRMNYVLKVPIMDEKSSEDFGRFAMNNGFDPDIIAFLYFKPQYLYGFDPKVNSD